VILKGLPIWLEKIASVDEKRNINSGIRYGIRPEVGKSRPNAHF